MTIREQILEKLKAGVHWNEIKKEYSGRSSLYGALDDYIIWIEPKVTEYQEKLQDYDVKLMERYSELEETGSAVTEARAERVKVITDIEEKRRELASLKHEEAETSKRYDKVNSLLKSLTGRGLTEGALSQILEMEYSSGNELLERASTSDKYSTLLVELDDAKREFNEIKSETVFLVSERKRIEEQAASEKNVLDELRRHRLMYEEANSVVKSFITEGYNSELLLSLLEALKSLAITGQKRLSIKRLIDGLNSARSLEELDSAILRKRAELKQVQYSFDAASGELEAIRDNTLAVIASSRKSATKEMRNMHSAYMDALAQMNEEYEKGLLGYREGQETQLSNSRIQAEEKIAELTTETTSRINGEILKFETRIANYEQQIRKWGAEKEEQGRLGVALKYGRMLHEASMELDLAKKFPISLIDRLVLFVLVWIGHNIPDEKKRPSKDTASLDVHIQDYTDYRILALIHIISEFFSTRH